MTQRPKKGRGPLTAVRSLGNYLRDSRIGIKLGFIMAVPTLAIVVVGATGLVSQISNEGDAERARSLATLSADAGALAHALQGERADAALVLGYLEHQQESQAAAAIQAYNTQTLATGKTAVDYTQQAAIQPDLPSEFRSILADVQTQLNALPSLRSQVTGSTKESSIPLSLAAIRYGALISRLLAIRDSAAQLTGDATLSYDLRAAAAISYAKEYESQERYQVLEVLQDRVMNAEQRREFIATLTGQQQSIDQFELVATPEQKALYQQTLSGQQTVAAGNAETLIEAMPTEVPPATLNVADWDSAMAARSELMRTVESSIDDETVQDATTLRNNAERQIILDVSLLFGLVLVAMLVAWSVARAMNRSLRELKHGALTVARYGLPQAVARLRDPTLATQLTPHQIALQIAEPLPIRSRDEFGEVTEAFNAVHLEAVRTAAEQAVLRSSVATMFVNLARRSQILVDRLIGHLDRLERGEEDPDRLAELFQLDHLATRMRRNDENLLVLAGADSTRVQRDPAPLVDVLRAAQSEVEHYTRIEFGVIDRDLEVAAHAVNDLVHLVAELLDNATAFSPPNSPVFVEARRVGDRAMLQVQDHGIGVSADQLADLNERLATPPLVDVAVSRMMGLVVVARLAARHGVKVELRPAPERGTVADVLLPTAVLTHRGAERPTRTGLAPNRDRVALDREPPRQRSPFSPPLELESGPSAGSPPHMPAGNGYGGGLTAAFGGFAAAADNFGVDRPVLMGPGSTSRALPSWSDLTGAAGTSPGATGAMPGNGSNGNGTHSPYGPETGGRYLFGGAPSFVGGQGVPPLPHRRVEENYFGPPDEPPLDERPRIPRQRPHAPLDEASLLDDFAEGELLDDGYRRDEPPHVPADRHGPASAPPSWPPVAVPPGLADEAAARYDRPPVDMTAEIPRFSDLDPAGPVRRERERFAEESMAQGADVYTAEAERVPGQRPAPEARGPLESFADATMELPIFRELESAWFATVDTGSRIGLDDRTVDDRTADPAVRQPTGVEASAYAARPSGGHPPAPYQPTGHPAMPGRPGHGGSDYYHTTGEPAMANPATSASPPADQAWRSPADDGWRAAAAASDPADGGVTEGGLPRRVPMAQLVPGGVEKATGTGQRRSPDAVRGLLSAYHRGVQRGRQQQSEYGNDTPESMTTGYPSPGREHDV
ncbi:MAG TPA: nitrate- and nitrite sensing domain-containing protein [Micromonosporaceae bacterium]|nr:nitrate- and nitrite sensing domain-containing protein [Micromonosporaceae bacterium]